MTGPVVLSLGSVNIDFQVRVEREPQVGETLLARDLVRLGGGKAANVALLARKLGHPAVLLAQVGDDVLSEWALDPLRKIGVDLTSVGVVAGAMSGVAMVAVPPDGRKMIIMAANANDGWRDADADRIEQAIARAPPGSVLVVDYEVPSFVVARATVQGHARGFEVVLDPSPADRVERQALSRVDVVVPNPKEAEGLTGVPIDGAEGAMEAGARLLDDGAGAACIKLADGGCVVVHRDMAARVGPVPVDVVDTTGAGDAFAGAMAVALLEKRPLLDAACFSTAASHIAVTGYGSQPAYPTRSRLDSLCAEIRTRVQMLG